MKSVCSTIVLVLVLACGTHAQQLKGRVEIEPVLINDVDQSAVALHPATPFLESSSLLLVDLDLEKIDVAAAMSWIDEFVGGQPLSQQSETVSGFLDSLKGGGVSHVYVTAATRSPLDGGPIFIIPCENPPVVNGLATVLVKQAPERSPQRIHVGDKVVVAGAEPAIKRVTAREGAQRPDLILPLRGDELLDHTAVLSLPSEAKEELQAFWPEQISGGLLPFPISPRQLVQDVSRAVVSIRLPPEPEMTVRLETTDANAADRVKQLIDKALSLQPQVQAMIQVDVEIANVTLRATPEAFINIVSTVIAPAQENARRMQRMNDFKQIGLAMHNYYATHKQLPPRCFTDAGGQPLLSWRVAILPFLEQLALYRAIKLDQAWDSEANQMVSSMVIPVFGYGVDPSIGNKTTMRAPVFPGSVWFGEGPPKDFKEVTDGLSNTIFVIDAPNSAAVPWASPQPWVLSEDDPMSDVFGDRQNVIVGMMDGSVIVLDRKEMTNERLKAMLTIAGGELGQWVSG